MKPLRILSGAVLAAAILFTAFFGANKISEKKSFAEEKPYKGVITVWQIDTFEGGTGSRKNFLLSAARGYERKENGVLVMVITHTEESAKEAFGKGETPDAVSYGTGFPVTGAKKLSIKGSSSEFSGGRIGDDVYAVPWCRGGYVLIENPSAKSERTGQTKSKTELPDLSEETLLVSEGEHTAPLCAAALSGLKIKSAEILSPMEAYVRFTEGKTRYFLGTQRDVVRLTRRETSFKIYPLSGYNDLYQYISLASSSPEKSVYAERFIEYLLSESVQKTLGKICMFSTLLKAEQESEALTEMQKICAASTVPFFIDGKSYAELKALSHSAATGNEKDLHKIKNFLA